MHRTLVAILLILSAGRAGAEDFSGFYAGVNAGYAFGRDRAEEQRAARPRAAAPGAPGPDLPPSAADAAATMRRPGQTGTVRR